MKGLPGARFSRAYLLVRSSGVLEAEVQRLRGQHAEVAHLIYQELHILAVDVDWTKLVVMHVQVLLRKNDG